MMSAEAGKILSVYDDPSDQQSLSLDDFTSTEESLDETTRLSIETTTDDAIPYIGQRFVTHDSAYQFYSEFAKRCGFSIRRHRTEGKDGVGMTAAGHSKSINSFIQRFLSAQTRLAQFVEQVGVAVDFKDQATEQQTMQQNLQNICFEDRSTYGIPRCVSPNSICLQ
ncbi:Protein FAR1-RELATED SEQUENCE 11 [Linum perenne]